MRRTVPMSIALLLLLSGGAAHARKSTIFPHRCESQANKTTVVINAVQNGYVINNKTGSRTLNGMSMSSLAGDYVIGLTSLRSTTMIDVDGKVWDDEETGGECFAPRIEININYAPLQVYIGKEFAPGTCAYDAILKHEMEHVQLYQAHLPRVETTLRSAMEKRFSGQPLYGRKGKVRQMLDKEIDDLWRPFIKAELAKVELDQQTLDTDESLSLVHSACLGEVKKVLGFKYY